MPDLLKQFRNHVTSSGIISSGSRGVVAVSGGIDSVVLLHLLTRCSGFLRLSLCVAHYNHGTRGRESDDDEAFVRDLARKWELEFYSGRMDTQQAGKGESWEALARDQRYRFLETVRDEHGFDWTATGHQADDQVETVIMRVVEGSGIQGLKGIRSRQGCVIRPLLPFTRDQIEAHGARYNLGFRRDSTNDDFTIPRNFVRHRIVPALRELNPSLSSAISRLVANVEEVDALVRKEMDELRPLTISKGSGRETVLDGKRLMESSSIVRKGLIRQLVSGGENGAPWRNHVWLDVEDFLNYSRTGQMIRLPGDWEMLKDRNRFLLRRGRTDPGDIRKVVNISPGRRTRVRIGSFELNMSRPSVLKEFVRDPSVEYLDAALLEGARVGLRLWRAGDRMKPLGLPGFKKVSDILVDEKIDRFSKAFQFVLTVNGKIAWLCGIRLDDRFKVSPETSQVVRLSWRRARNGRKGDETDHI